MSPPLPDLSYSPLVATVLLVAQALALMGLPALVLATAARWPWVKQVGPVVWCYALGILWAQFPDFRPSGAVAQPVRDVAVILAIPLLLFSVDVAAWRGLARGVLTAFGLACACVVAVVTTTGLLWPGELPDRAILTGMFTAMYIGGTPNFAAVGAALGVDPATQLLATAADVATGAVYLMLILTVLPRIAARFLPPTPIPADTQPHDNAENHTLPASPPAGDVATATGTAPAPEPGFPWRRFWPAIPLALVVVAVALAVAELTPPNAKGPVALLGASALAVAASMIPAVRRLPGTAAAGDYLLLVFSLSMGTEADLARVWAATGGIMGFVATTLCAVTITQLAAFAVCRVDRDTAIMALAATVFGPPFVGPVALALGNHRMVFPGIAMGLAGYALANALGLAVATGMGSLVGVGTGP